MILSPSCGGILSDASETSAVEEQCDLLESASSSSSLSSVSCCSSNYSGEFDQTEMSWINDNFDKRREEGSVNVDPAAVEMKEVESSRIKKQRKRCETTVKEAELEDFFLAAEKHLRSEMLEYSTKYNFDFENDEPLDGRYKWLKFNP